MKSLFTTVFLFFCISLFPQSISQDNEIILTGGNSQSIVNAINSLNQNGTITIKGDIEINTDVTIPKNIVLRFFKGNKLKLTRGKITFNESFIDAGIFQIFDFSSFHYQNNFAEKVSKIIGEVKNSIVYPEWFGGIPCRNLDECNNSHDYINDDAFAIQLAINITNNKIVLSNGIYYIYHGLEKNTINNEETQGVKIIGNGPENTIVKVMKNNITFLTLRGGATWIDRLVNNEIEGMTINGNGRGLNGLSFYSCWYNNIFEVNLKSFKNAGIVFEGDPTKNPDLTATTNTTFNKSEIKYCKVGILNKLNNNSPLFSMENAYIVNNKQAGIIWNSSYFTSSNSSIAYNGVEGENPLGGFYNDYLNYYNVLPSTYVSKGIVLKTTEFDSNYPSSITLQTTRGAEISNCSIEQNSKNSLIKKFTNKGVIRIGGNEKIVQDTIYYYYRSRNTLIKNNSIKLINNNGVPFEANACAVRLSDGALFTKIENNSFHSSVNNTAFQYLGDKYFFVKEYKKTGEKNKLHFDKEESYVKLKGNQGSAVLSDPTNLSLLDKGFNLVLPKFKKENYGDYGKKFKKNDEVFIKVPITKSYDGVSVKSGAFIISSNDPVKYSGLFFYRADTYPDLVAAYSSSKIRYANQSININGMLNISVDELYKGRIRLKYKADDARYITITFLNDIGMFNK